MPEAFLLTAEQAGKIIVPTRDGVFWNRPCSGLFESLSQATVVHRSVTNGCRIMSKQRFITLGELCEVIGIGKGRFYKLQRDGYFPEPVRGTNGRPFFSQELIEECQTIVRTRVGKNGLPLSFNRKTAAAPKKQPATNKHEDLLASLRSLGLQATPSQVDAVLETLPQDLPEGEVIKAVFRELKKQG